MERTITFEKSPLTLTGRLLQLDTKAPHFTALSGDLEDITLASYGDRIKLISFFPSIDHPICDLQVREMNKKARDLPETVVVIGISMDIPFAPKRFRETFDIRHIDLISDHRYRSFGLNYGVLIRELNLLARGALILDQNNVLRYRQIVKELSHQPDFEDIFAHLEEVRRDSGRAPTPPVPLECKPFSSDVPAFSSNELSTRMPRVPLWRLVDDKKIYRQFTFSTPVEAKSFLDILSIIAEEQGHHPSFVLNYNRLKVTLTSYTAGGLTDNDFIMARIIDQLAL
jgi:thiol peroxidase